MEQSPREIRIAEIADWRVQVINDLCDLADILRNTTPDQFPTPNVYLSCYTVETPTDDDIYRTDRFTHAHARAAMAATPGNWSKYVHDDFTRYTKAIGKSLRMAFEVSRATTCRRVKAGVEVIPAEPERTVDKFTWVCDGPEDASVDV